VHALLLRSGTVTTAIKKRSFAALGEETEGGERKEEKEKKTCFHCSDCAPIFCYFFFHFGW
jgi:hypothetical protein